MPLIYESNTCFANYQRVIVSGCKKDSSQKAKIYQLNSLTYTQNGVNTTAAIYTYDAQGRLSAYNDTRLGNIYKYTYLDNGLPYSITTLSSDGEATTYVTYNYTTK